MRSIFYNIQAALMFFTRLPWWRLFSVPNEYFRQVINYWAVAGWLTASVMAGSLWLSAQALPYSVALIIALLSRILLTGALHEDGLADFFDGFGGGTNKERILSIMKDSHIGTYGVISLIFYFLLFFQLLQQFSLRQTCLLILVADPLCKLIGSFMTLRLPYARNEETSKIKVVYTKLSLRPFLISLPFGLLPLLLLLPPLQWFATLAPLAVFLFLTWLMKRKIQGYTGDCCGATFLLCELSFYIGYIILVDKII